MPALTSCVCARLAAPCSHTAETALHHSLTRIWPYSPTQLFDLVADVERYPQFIHWITSLRVWNRVDLGEGVSRLDAEAEVKFSIVRERFATRVRFDRPAGVIDVDLLSGPFRRLENRWSFVPDIDGTQLSFDIDFEFGSRFLEVLLQANFHSSVLRIVACFETRARQLYG